MKNKTHLEGQPTAPHIHPPSSAGGGEAPVTGAEDAWTLGALSEEAWKELRLPLGLKE